MKQIIEKLNSRIAAMQTEIEDTTKAIIVIQGVCEHDYKHTGFHDQKRKEYLTCTICGKEDVRDV
jgi:hypothetical protein